MKNDVSGKIWEFSKTILSILEVLLPWLEKQASILPVNPAIRSELMLLSAVFAGVAGIGSYRSTKLSDYARKWLWLWGLGLSAIIVLLQIGLEHGMPLPAAFLPFGARALYVLFFLTFGISVGGVLGLTP